MDANKSMTALGERMATVADLRAAGGVLTWHRQTYMPSGGVESRAEQLATLSRLAHETLAAGETARLLDAAGDPEPGSDAAALVRLARREHERAVKLPPRLVEESSRATALSEPVWRAAREASDFSRIGDHFERVLSLRREVAELLSSGDHPYDALLDLYEPGATTASLREMFEKIKTETLPLVRAISERSDDDRDAPLRGPFDEGTQGEFARGVIGRFGYDWKRGRLDRAAHPFCINFGGPGDVRMTTRFDPEHFSVAFFATCHEAGHALYEQGVDPAYARSPVTGGVSMGVHESQSRLWENLVARSRPFWSHFYPKLREAFPAAFDGADLDTFHRAVNTVRPTPIRTEADELTYNFHILIRFELEIALFEDDLSITDLPDAWNAKTHEYLGFTPKNAAEGILQDVHWPAGYFGYFPMYTVGNFLSAQLFDAATEQHPSIRGEMATGEFGTLLAWLRDNIHRFGSKHDPQDLIESATGRPLDTAPYLHYLKTKFGELYDLG